MSSDRPPIPRVRQPWLWALGAALGLGLAALHPWGAAVRTDAADDVVRYEVDLSRDWTPADVRELTELARRHPGQDILLEPARGTYQVPPGDQRRSADEQRAKREAGESAAWVEEARQRGVLEEPATTPTCRSAAAAAAGAPSRYLLCDGDIVPARTRVPAGRVASRQAAETRLTAHLRSVLAGVDPQEAALGLSSSFSDASALESLTFDRDGSVTVDFNVAVVPQVERIHPGFASHFMLEQLFSTLFQFRDVTSVTLTYAGDCEAFGQLIAGPCQSLDRGLWEHIQDLNDHPVEYFALGGV